jgi:lipid-A-disaccharide synthase-like uncharacterized protein
MGWRICVIIWCLCAGLRAADWESLGRPFDETQVDGPVARLNVDLPGAKDNVKIVPLKDGSMGIVVKRLGAGTDRVLTAEEFTRVVHQQSRQHGWLGTIFNISSPVGLLWISLGLGGQILFSGRMLVQWFASERSRRSVIPVAFWWMSLVGATMLLVYFLWRRDIVGVLGQATGWIIYIRNLVLIRRADLAGA